MASTLAESHKVSVEQNLLGSFSATLSTDQDEIWCDDKGIQVEDADAPL